jgi:hypothetical protein
MLPIIEDVDDEEISMEEIVVIVVAMCYPQKS